MASADILAIVVAAPIEVIIMTICPIALAVGCKKCPLFKICPAKGLVGDYKPEEEASTDESTETASSESNQENS